jgi:hypothetical protein
VPGKRLRAAALRIPYVDGLFEAADRNTATIRRKSNLTHWLVGRFDL